MKKNVLSGILGSLMPMAGYASGYIRPINSYLVSHAAPLPSNTLLKHSVTSSPQPRPTVTAEQLDIQAGQAVNELVIIDAAVQDKHLLYKNIRPGVDVVEIDGNRDGLSQLKQILSRYHDLAAVHLVSHASDGVILLGNQRIDEAVLEQDLSLFNKLNGAIRQGGDLLFYGCDLAASSKGEELLALIKGNTHIDIAASNNKTGSDLQGGDWTLEITQGKIDAQIPFSEKALADFSGVLTTYNPASFCSTPECRAPSVTSTDGNLIVTAKSGTVKLYTTYTPQILDSYSGATGHLIFSAAGGKTSFQLTSLTLQAYGGASCDVSVTGLHSGSDVTTPIQPVSGSNPITHNVSALAGLNLTSAKVNLANCNSAASVGVSSIDATNFKTNSAPTNISLSATSINQANTGTNATVGSLSTTDTDSGDTHSYSLVTNGTSANGSCGASGDANNASFNINGSDLRTANSLSAGSYNVCVQTDDSTTSYQKTFAVTVNPTTSATTTAAGFNTTNGSNLSPSFNFGSSDETLTLGAANHTIGSTANGGTGTDTLVAVDGANLSQLTQLTGFETLTIPANASVAMSSTQHQSFTTFTDNANQTIQLVSGSDNITGNANIDSYELGASYSGTFTLGSGSQSVLGGSGNDTVNISGLTVTGTLAGNAGTDTLILGAGADISGATISGFENFTQAGGATTTVAANQLAQFTGTVTATGIQIINVNGDGNFTTPIGIETISVGDSSTNTRTVTVAAADTSVSATSATDAITFEVGSLTYTGTLTGDNTVSDTLYLANGANISAATINNITNLTLDSNASVTMTRDQHSAFTGTVIATGIETITINGDGNVTTFADVEKYVIGDSSTNTRQITLNAFSTNTNVTVNSALDGSNNPNENITFVVQGSAFNGHLSAINSLPTTVNITQADTNLVGAQFTNVSELHLANNISVTLDSNAANAVPSYSGSNNTLQLSGGGTFDFTPSSFNSVTRIELKDNNGFDLRLPSSLGTSSIDIGEFSGVTITQDVRIDASLLGGSLNMTAQNFSGTNTFIGGNNNDTLHAGTGIDTMTGNLGSDSFVGSAAQLDGDTITDVSVGDRIVITGVTGLSQANVRFIGSSMLEIDTNATDFATPEVSLTLSNAPGATLGFSLSSSGSDTVLTAVQLPTVNSSNISISGASGTNGAYRVGDTVTVTWNNSGSGDNNAGISGVTVDFSAFGGPSDVMAMDMGGDLWTATYQLTNSVTNGSNINVSVTASNSGGSSSTTDNSNATVDGTPPSGHSVSFDDNMINAAESSTQSFTFAGAEVGASYSYTISSSGGGTSVTGSGTMATATDQITGLNLSGLADGTLTLSVVLTDGAGNSAVAVTSTAVLDVTPPSGHSVTFDSNSYNASPISFTFAGAEVGASYSYSISSSGGGAAVVGSGTISAMNMQIGGVDVSGLGDGTLTLSVVLTDTAGNAAIAVLATTALALVPTNTAPTLTATATNPSYTAGNATPATLFAGAAVSTQDANQTINSLTLTVSNVDSNAEEFIVADGTAIQLIAGNGSTANNSLSYLVTVNNAIATITLTGAISSDSAQTLVNGLAYRYSSALAADAQRVVTLTSIVDSGADNNSSSLAIASAVALHVAQPVISNNSISISGASGTNGAYTVGDTVTVVWNNSSSGDNNASVTGVTVDFSAFGGPSNVVATESNGLWTATYQIASDVTDGNNLNVSVSVTNPSGTIATTNNANATVDSTPPSGHSVSFDDSMINATESSTQSFTFAGAEVGASYSYTISSSGGGTAVTGSGTVATASDQITGLNLSGLADGTLTLSVVLTDGAGNSAVAVTDTAVLDVTPPSGHFVSFDSNSYNVPPISFTFAGAELGASYSYSISSSGGGAAVVGSGTISAMNMQIGGVDVSGLGDGTLTLSVVLTDTAGNAAIAALATSALALVPTNTAPTLTATATNPSYTAGNATPATLFAGAAVSTQDTNQTINSLTLTVNNVDSNAEEFIVADGTAIQLIAGNGSTANNSLSYLVTVNNAIATVTLTGAISSDSAQTLVNGLAYRYSSALAADAQRVVTLTTIVDSGADNNSSSLAIASAVSVMLANRAPEISGSPSNAAQEGVSYSFTPTAIDADGDPLTFNITNLPSWASFDSNTGTLSGTPSLSAAGDYSNIVISVSDGELSASLSAFSITVVNTNQPPVISGTPPTGISVGQQYRFVASASDADAGTRLTFSISSLPSWLSFNTTTGELAGIAADAHVGQYSNISISVSDGIASASLPAFNISVQAGIDTDGDTVSDYQEGLDGTNPNDPQDYRDTEAPQLQAPDSVLLDATALFTPVNLRQLLNVNASATDEAVQAALNSLASDNIDGDNCCAPAVVGMDNGLLHLKPGRNEVVWQAADRKGNQANATQVVNIRPLVSFSKSQTVAEGANVEFNILLNGKSPFYPLEVPFIIDEGASSASAEDHTLVNGSVIFEQDQTSATIRFATIQDNNLEGDETLVVLLDDHTSDAEDLQQGNNADINDINAGVPARFTATIVEGNLPPRVTLKLAQNGVNTIKITPTNGDVTVTATATDANVGDSVTLDWSNNSSLINLSDDPTRFVFSPAALTSGSYNVNVVASDEQNASTTATFRFVVVSALPALSSSVDSDADGIDDATEGMADSDNDGIPDYLDNLDAPNVLPEIARRTNSFLLECEPGISCRLGELAIQTDSGGALLPPEEMNSFTTLTDDVGYTSSGLFDFEMAELPNAGQSVAIVVPQLVSIPSQAVYRKFSNGSWRNFVEDGNNTLASALGSEGFCPPPGDESWQPGLTAGHWCMQLTIEDGGPNDADGEANGSVADPGGVAVANSSGNDGSDDGAEPIIPRRHHGGALGFAWLIWLTMIGIIRIRVNKKQG